MNVVEHDAMMSCRAALKAALSAACDLRSTRGDWNDDEREERAAVLLRANEWAVQHDLPAVTADQVETADRCASGHVDWSSKLPLYVAEMLYGVWTGP